MIKLGVVSDTHGYKYLSEKLLALFPDITHWVHLGDGAEDISALKALPSYKIFSVKGNCDFFTSLPNELVINLENVNLLALHGDKYHIQYDKTPLYYRAEELGCSVVLYGHTHQSAVEANGSILAINPGSPVKPRGGMKSSVAILTIDDKTVYPSIVTL